MIFYTLAFVISGLIFTVILYVFTIRRSKEQKKIHEQNTRLLKNIMLKANLDFDNLLLEENKSIAGCIEGFFNEEFITNYIEHLIFNNRIIYPSLFVIISCMESDLTDEEAEKVGRIIKTEFNGNIICGVTKSNSRPNYTFYIFFEGRSENDINEFLVTTIDRMEKKVSKKFTYSLNKIRPKL
ncbi:MAG: hypothetical protein K5839_03670 [Treponemataceae bacterium]|nr:hypothetical protein [Treponemataceae bacterium]